MCHCEDLNNCKNSPLNRVDFLYDSELNSDVIFLVGTEPDVWRIPGHKKILSQANPVFRALMEGPLATRENMITIEDVEGRAFDYLLRYLYGNTVTFQSPATALSTMYAAHKYLCSGLIELCVKYLDENLNSKNVLEVYTHARLYTVENGKTKYEPSAPVASNETCDLHTPVRHYPPTNNNHDDNSIGNLINNNNNNNNCVGNDNDAFTSSSIPFWSEALVHNCLQYIDENADQVLNQEAIEDVSIDNLREIVRRDTLKIKSESVVFSALDRWANRECKRRKINSSPKNRRIVLEDLIYEIRFPFFTPEEFVCGPIQAGWLDQQELTFFSALISKSKPVGQVPHAWKQHEDKICRKRIYSENEIFTLSRRTYLIDVDKSKDKDLKKNVFSFGKMKSRKSGGKEKGQKGRTNENEKSCTKCLSEFMVDMLVCLFD